MPQLPRHRPCQKLYPQLHQTCAAEDTRRDHTTMRTAGTAKAAGMQHLDVVDFRRFGLQDLLELFNDATDLGTRHTHLGNVTRGGQTVFKPGCAPDLC